MKEKPKTFTIAMTQEERLPVGYKKSQTKLIVTFSIVSFLAALWVSTMFFGKNSEKTTSMPDKKEVMTSSETLEQEKVTNETPVLEGSVEEKTLEVLAAEVKEQEFTKELASSEKIDARDKIAIHPMLNLKLEQIHVSNGLSVKKGQALIDLDEDYLNSKMELLNTGLENLKNQKENLDTLKENVSKAEKEAKSLYKNYKGGLVSRQKAENAINKFKQLAGNYQEVKGSYHVKEQFLSQVILELDPDFDTKEKKSLSLLEESVNKIKTKIPYLKILAPQGGIVASLHQRVGETALSPLMEILLPESIFVMAKVAQKDLPYLKDKVWVENSVESSKESIACQWTLPEEKSDSEYIDIEFNLVFPESLLETLSLQGELKIKSSYQAWGVAKDAVMTSEGQSYIYLLEELPESGEEKQYQAQKFVLSEVVEENEQSYQLSEQDAQILQKKWIARGDLSSIYDQSIVRLKN